MSDETTWVSVREVYLETEQGKGNMVILKADADSDRFFLMFVGDAEFAAIAKEKGFLDPKRPLTHDLYLRIVDILRPEFLRVEIHEMREETYYARVVLRFDGAEQAVDSRPSDAVALALNRNIPILVNQALFRRKLSQEEIKEYEGLVKSVKF